MCLCGLKNDIINKLLSKPMGTWTSEEFDLYMKTIQEKENGQTKKERI